MNNVFPEELNPLPDDPKEAVKKLEGYIRYMCERMDFALSAGNNANGMSYRELVRKVNEIDGEVDNKANMSDITNKVEYQSNDIALYPHSVGDYFINKNGEYCICKSSISVGQTLTKNTNYTVTDIGSEVTKINSKISHIGMIIQSTTLNTMAKVIAIYGGTEWVQIQGRFLLGASSGHAVNSTGGSETVTLTVNQIPSHNHTGATGSDGSHRHDVVSDSGAIVVNAVGTIHAGTSSATISGNGKADIHTTSNGSHTHTITAQGGGKAHDNMPPYKTVYIWERTA